jgi:DNA repair ATPase RecN
MSSFSSDIKDVLFKLWFLAKIKPDQKVNVTTMSFVSSNSIWGSIFRSLYGENRMLTLEFIAHVIDLTNEVISRYQNNKRILDCVLTALHEASEGIRNLLSTYKDDPQMSSKLEVYLEQIKQMEKD